MTIYDTEKDLQAAATDAIVPKEASSGETPDSVNTIEEETPAPVEDPISFGDPDFIGPPPPPVNSPVTPHIHWIKLLVEPGQLVNNTTTLIRVLNEKFFKEAGEYLGVQVLRYANVPSEFREAVSDALGMDISDSEWENDDGLVMFGTQSFLKSVFAAFNSRNISSFPSIMVGQGHKDVQKVVSFSVGYASRPDGIVTDMQWNQDLTQLLFSPRVTPVNVQTVYSIARRWEDESHRNRVLTALTFILNHSDTDADTPPSYVEVADDGTALAELKVGDTVFSEAAIKRAIHQAHRLVGVNLGSSLLAPPDARELAEELMFILNSGLFYAFFPKVNSEDASLVHSTYFISEIGEDVSISIPHYRTVAKSPLTTLQVNPSKDPDNIAESEIYTTKLMWLNSFLKNIINVKITTLGIPEMDIWGDEVGSRKIVLDVHEPRLPGTQHWLSGIYNVWGVNHSVTRKGYFTEFNLQRSLMDTAENWSKFTILRDYNV